MDELQLEETQRTNQQSQDIVPHDPNSAAKYPGGYTPVGLGEDNTPVEQVSPGSVPEVEVTSPILNDIIPQDVYGSSGDNISFANRNIPEVENTRIDSITPVRNANVTAGNLPGIDSVPNSSSNSDGSPVEETVVDPPTPPVDPPLDPEEPDPEDPEPPVDPPLPPPEPPVDPPVDPEDPEDPDPEDPEDPEDPLPPPEDPDPEDPEEPEDPEDPDPEDPPPPPEDPDPEDPEEPNGGNPGNDKEVGNSPWDGETGASDNPGKGNHQDGQDPEPNQPPGDSKNDGGKNNDSEDPPSSGGNGGKPENQQDNGWGNGDDDSPGNSGPHNNAENDATPSEHYDNLVGRFLEENSGRFPEENPIDVTYNWEQDNDSFLDYTPEFDPRFDHVPEISHFDNFDHPMDHGLDHFYT